MGEGRRDLLLTKLTPYSQYSITVAAFTVVGPGPPSLPVRMQTLEDRNTLLAHR